jgi:hypothetical protein
MMRSETTSPAHATPNDFFETEGYFIVPNLIPQEKITQLISEMDDLAGRADVIDPHNLRCRFQLYSETGNALLESIDPVTDLLPTAAEIAQSADLLSVLARLLGSTPRLFKDKLILKPRGCRGYALHQDYIHWPFFPKSFTTVVIALDPSTTSNGCIEIYPREHHSGYLSRLDGDFHDLPDSMFEGKEKVSLQLHPGDAAVFGCYLPHRSGPNITTAFRRQLYLSFNPDQDGGDQRTAHYRDFHRWLKKRHSEYGTPQSFFK